MTTKQTDEYLQRLRRLPSNKTCANCQATSRLGFGAVCMKYSTFVCDNCKSAHQGFSHLCKSVSMSNWTMEEVRTLEGGNAACRAKWFAKMSQTDRERYTPREGSVILEEYKRLVQLVYEEKRWLGTTPVVTQQEEQEQKMPKQRAVAAPQVQKVVEEDLLLLDFSEPVRAAPQQSSAFSFMAPTPTPLSSVQQPQQQPNVSPLAFVAPAQQTAFPTLHQQQSAPSFFAPSPPPLQQHAYSGGLLRSASAPAAFEDPFLHLSMTPSLPPQPATNAPAAAAAPSHFKPKPVASANDPFAGLL